MNINIRKAEVNDLNFLLKLENESFPPFQRNSKQNIKHGINSKFQEILIAETGQHKEGVGAVVLFKYKKTIRIYSIAVLPAHQNMGIGDVLLKHVFELANRNQIEKVVLEVNANNTKLVDWYKTRGFSEQGILPDYYSNGDSALKMEYKTNAISISKKTRNVIVINQPYKWNLPEINATIITVKEYINNPIYQNSSDFRIFNLCSSYRYQSYGYYVSLLASARGQRVIPSTSTIRDYKILKVIHSAAYDIDELINKSLNKENGNSFSLNIYFGQTNAKAYKALSLKLYQLFEAPLFKIDFVKHDKWLIKDISFLTLNKIPKDDFDIVYEFARKYFNKKRFNISKLTNFKYDLAILVNPQEDTPPSCPDALQKFVNAANKKGVYAEFITKADRDKINEFDALFIRETTSVNDHTYEISKMAYAEGLVVIDDPWSILKCSNKIYQNEIFKKHKILTPKTTVFTKNLFNKKILEQMNFPLVLKQPDSAFSLGVTKAENIEEAVSAIKHLFKKSDMIICQEFLYSEFDWRIGMLDNNPLFACKYYMSKNHWQIYNWKSDEIDKSGDWETLSIDKVPRDVLQTAQKASLLIGDGLYGVDLKMVDDKVYVVEVNDNPNIDLGVEDFILKDRLYEIFIESIINRIEIAKNIQKINFTTK